MASVEWRSLHDEHEQDDDSGRVTPDGVEVAAAFAVAQVNVIGVAVAVAVVLQFAGMCARTVRARRSAFYVVRRRQIIE